MADRHASSPPCADSSQPFEADEGAEPRLVAAARRPPPKRRPRVRSRARVEGRRAASRLLAVAIASSGTSCGAVARALEMPPNVVQRWADHEELHAMAVGDVIALARLGHRDVAQAIAAALAAVVLEGAPRPPRLPDVEHLRLVTRELLEIADVVTELGAPGFDQRRTVAKLRHARRLSQRALALCADLEAELSAGKLFEANERGMIGMSVEIVRVPVGEDFVDTTQSNGKIYVVLKPALESVGVAYKPLLRKLKTRSWATVTTVVTVGADGKERVMVAVDLRTFLMLLATVDENSVNDGARPKLIRWQADVADIIEAYYTKGGAVNPRATLIQLERLRETIDLYVSKDPSKYRVLWERRAISAIGNVYRLPVGDGDPTPVWFGNIAGNLYEKALSFIVTDTLRDRSLAWSGEHDQGYVHLHRMLTPEARQYMNCEVSFIKELAETSRTKSEFWQRVDHRYEGKPFQHGFGF